MGRGHIQFWVVGVGGEGGGWEGAGSGPSRWRGLGRWANGVGVKGLWVGGGGGGIGMERWGGENGVEGSWEEGRTEKERDVGGEGRGGGRVEGWEGEGRERGGVAAHPPSPHPLPFSF